MPWQHAAGKKSFLESLLSDPDGESQVKSQGKCKQRQQKSQRLDRVVHGVFGQEDWPGGQRRFRKTRMRQ
jgi:hypothetical protein